MLSSLRNQLRSMNSRLRRSSRIAPWTQRSCPSLTEPHWSMGKNTSSASSPMMCISIHKTLGFKSSTPRQAITSMEKSCLQAGSPTSKCLILRTITAHPSMSFGRFRTPMTLATTPFGLPIALWTMSCRCGRNTEPIRTPVGVSSSTSNGLMRNEKKLPLAQPQGSILQRMLQENQATNQDWYVRTRWCTSLLRCMIRTAMPTWQDCWARV